MKKKYIIISVISMIIILSTLGFYFLKKSTNNTAKAKKVELLTIAPKEKIFINGVISPEKSEDIFLDPTKGTVDKTSVKNGQVVKKDEVLFTYKSEVVSEQIKQVNRQLSSSNAQKKQLVAKQGEAKKQLLAQQEQAKKNQSLLAGGNDNLALNSALAPSMDSQLSAYKDQIDSVQLQIESFESELKGLKEKEFTTIKAPMDGRVILHDTKSNPTSPYITIETATFYVKGSINEKQQPKIKENQSAEILILSTSKAVSGKITSIGNRPTAPQVTAQAITGGGGDSNISYYSVNIAFDSQEGLTNGFHVQASIKLDDEAIKIPKTAILKENDKSYVFKAVDNKLTKQEITYTESDSKEVVINSGLQENDVVVTNPREDMKEGNPVE
ncbi:efflux RND transporter periplasmic adaptor subunit [Clostridium sp. UBA4548]|uniref:efflux RND transporter periplasmic adaptor subunit n=1 Tax=Clostridium sp. UBA4548 TaxID=1946361 RepID=UPI0025BB4420|nr:biotin/lipoyl-binding protein [Clostridium sp. UBA4548]